jgi:hypothetical protein
MLPFAQREDPDAERFREPFQSQTDEAALLSDIQFRLDLAAHDPLPLLS